MLSVEHVFLHAERPDDVNSALRLAGHERPLVDMLALSSHSTAPTHPPSPPTLSYRKLVMHLNTPSLAKALSRSSTGRGSVSGGISADGGSAAASNCATR